MKHWLIFLLAAALLGACATQDETAAVDAPTPAAVASSDRAVGQVHWGGQIVKVRNLRDRTLIEVLALPLNASGKPLTDEGPQGRFIVDKKGFLEPHKYAPDRLVEVRGHLNGFTDGKVGQSPYRYPVVISERVKLWPEEAVGRYGGSRVSPRVNIGVGSGGSNVGVGVGVGFGF